MGQTQPQYQTVPVREMHRAPPEGATSMKQWRIDADAALTDLNAALTAAEVGGTVENASALQHLIDARLNIDKAIEQLEADE
jgi:hypothetical protein